MKIRQRYILLTVDVEALPRRAISDHVSRLVWGRCERGTAGIREICFMGQEFGIKHIFFVDICGAYSQRKEIDLAIRWLDGQRQDVQLHLHPEVLPVSFWKDNGFSHEPALMNEYVDQKRAEFVIEFFSEKISHVTGKKILACRAGSFRWNANTIRALKAVGIPLSFNNSMRAYQAHKCCFSEPTNLPFFWSNGVIEVPVTERKITSIGSKNERWVSLTYPESNYFRFGSKEGSALSRIFHCKSNFSVFLLHSWSMLHWDKNGHAFYQDDQRLEDYRKLLSRVSKDYDVITTADFLDLYSRGKIRPMHTVDIERAEFRK